MMTAMNMMTAMETRPVTRTAWASRPNSGRISHSPTPGVMVPDSTTAKDQPRRIITDSEDSSLLHKAVHDRRLHQIRLLMSLGVDVDKKDPQGRTPMMVATTMDPEEFGLKLMRMCIKRNADVNQQDNRGRSVLGYACVNGKAKMAHCLLQSACHLLVKNLPDSNGDVQLNLAAAHGHERIVKRMIDSLLRDGLSIDVRNNQGCTALILAAKYGHYKCAQILLQDGNASANLRDNEFFMSPLEWAQFSQSHFERELKLLRVIHVTKSTRSELLNLRAPAWCNDGKKDLNALPSLTVMTSGERPNFQKKKQLISQLHTRQTQLNYLSQALMPRIPEQVSYARKLSFAESADEEAADQIMKSVNASTVNETSPMMISPRTSPRRAAFPTSVSYRANTTSPDMPFLCTMFRLVEGNVGVRPSQAIGQQAAAALVADEATASTTPRDDAQAETDANETDRISPTPPASVMTRRKSRQFSKRSNSSVSSHSQNLAVPQVLRKTKTTVN